MNFEVGTLRTTSSNNLEYMRSLTARFGDLAVLGRSFNKQRLTFCMKRLFALLATLCAVWVLWSGHFSGFLLTMGGLSCLSVCWISKRMGLLDRDGVPIELRLWQSMGYLIWLSREVILANISVIKILMRRQLVIRRAIFDIRTSPQTNLGKVIMANSITLTPGTVTTKVHEGSMQVHALVDPGLNDPTIRAIDTRVRGLEGLDV